MIKLKGLRLYPLVFCVIFLALFPLGCKKDALISDSNVSDFNNFKKHTWNQKEALFFDTNPRIYPSKSNSKLRSGQEQGIFHPMLVAAYNEIALQNETHHFVDSLVIKVGLPNWHVAMNFIDFRSPNTNIVIVPVESQSRNHTNGLIVVNHVFKNGQSYFNINAISRTDLLDENYQNFKIEQQYLSALYRYDSLIFNHVEENLKNTSCEMATYANLHPNLEPTLNYQNCVPVFLNTCYNSVTGKWWFGWLPKSENHDVWDGDHDDDGILDADDQDYNDFIDRINDWWEDNYGDENWWSDHDKDGVANNNDSDWTSWFGEWLEDFGDWFSDGIADFFDWIGDQWDEFDDWWDWYWSDPCPFGANGQNEVRTITCQQFVVWDCNGDLTDWWDNFKCPECDYAQGMNDLRAQRIRQIILKYNIPNNRESLLLELSDGCILLDPDFEKCLIQKYNRLNAIRFEFQHYDCYSNNQAMVEGIDKFLIKEHVTELAIDAAGYHLKFSCDQNTYFEYPAKNQTDLYEWMDPQTEHLTLGNYMATCILYDSWKNYGPWQIADQETLQFYIEFFENQLVPLGITFIPYGIGDIADIYQSCGSTSWTCMFAIAGILVPFDELYDLWKARNKVKAAYKVTLNAEHLKVAWKFMSNCPKEIRTKPDFLNSIHKALNRTLKGVNELVSYAGVNYIDVSTINHIFRGSNNGGVHHISALIADPDTYKIHNRVEIPGSGGCYRAKIHKDGIEMYSGHADGKSFFPDTWNEEQVVNAIKGAWENKTPNGTSFLGNGNGISIRILLNPNGTIKSAYPN